MDIHGNKNYIKLAFILLDPVTKELRYIFRQKWDTQYPNNPWHDDNKSLQYLKKEAQKHGTWKQSNVPKSGDSNDWDSTNLFYVLLNSNTIRLSTEHNQHIRKLREIRNEYFAHPSTASINDNNFEAIYQDIEKCMNSLNWSSCVRKQVEDIKNGILKVPEDYLEGLLEKLDIIKTVGTDNNNLLKQFRSLLQKYEKNLFILPVVATSVIVAIVAIFFIYLFVPYLHPSYDHIDLSTRTTCNNFFPESRKPRYYIGHDWEINTGASVLANGSYSMVSITGPPAIGKSATAIAIGQVLKNNHGYQVAFVDFKQKNVSSSHIRTDIYKDIVLSIDFELENVPDSVQEFKLLMIKLTKFPTLLIFDNVEDILNSTSKEIFYKITEMCLEINQINILTTSRKEFDIIGVATHQITLEPLPKSKSNDLLFDLLPEFRNKILLQKIVEKTGGIPLLLEVAANLIRSKHYEEAELLKRFEELPILVVLNDTKDLTESSNYYKLLRILFDCLDPCVQVTFMGFGAVPIILDWTSSDAVVNLNFSKKSDLYPLVNYNLLKTFDLPNGQRLYGMHPVISEFSRLVAEDYWLKMQHARFGSFYALKTESRLTDNCESLPDIVISYSDITLQQPIWGHDILKIVVHNELTECGKRCLIIEDINIAMVFYERGQYTKCIDALLQANKLLKDYDNDLRKFLSDFALTRAAEFLKQCNNSDMAKRFFHLSLETLKMIKTDPCFVAKSLIELGNLSNDMRFYKDAVFTLKQALTNYEQQYQQQNCSKENLGSLAFKVGVIFYIRGKYDASINALLMSVNLLKCHDDQLDADWILAVSYYKTQNYKTSFQIVRRVLSGSYEAHYYKENDMLHFLTYLALKAAHTYLNESNIDMTIHFSNLSLNTLKRLEMDSCLVSSFYFDVGIMFYATRMSYRHAAFAFNQTWTFKKKNKCDDISVGLVAYYLGEAYYHCGQYHDSIDVLRRAVDLLEKDDVHLFTANSFLASSYYEIQEHERGLQITRNILNSNSYFNILNSSLLYVRLINLTKYALLAATEYHNQGKLNQSIEFYNLAVATLEMANAQPFLIASVYFELGIILNGAQKHGDAAFALTKALKFYERNGSDEERIGVTAVSIGESLYKIGQYRKSIEVLLEKIDLFKKNPDLEFDANYILVLSYLGLQDYENSFQLLSTVLNNPHVDNLMCKQWKLEIMKKLARKYLQTQNANESTKYGNVYMYTFISIIFFLFCIVGVCINSI